ncbi:hypothetical protein BVRB_4g077350 [Beta vulgaris subsp. vulgaris]|uniref:uncharacterized protein LOC104890449 n=1 Tax=Beta vulgaris subsp. vulgaris TaxID=3555 RepID=UPI00053F67DB|nr:uncharacterized protein LOC104890449 [Beta vulgaris subsp. vulgaris]KMT13893.1 hypothetical protein BVRB_4g077350 [Beta vulgaris subsp. vulgaris]
MSAQFIEKHREGAEIYTGAQICKQKSLELLLEINMPNGLLPMDDFEEVGYNRSTGFVWLTQKKPVQHKFTKIGKQVSYDTHVTAFVENQRMKKLHGVKAKELLIWISLNEIYIDDPASGKITFGTPTGISRSYPISAFEEEKK